MNSSIIITNLSVSYSKKEILGNVNITLKRGSFTVLLGANGAGKSTLLKAVCGLERFKGGISIFGKDLKKTDRKIIGYVPQNNAAERNCPVSVFEAVSIGRFANKGIFAKFGDEDKTIVKKAIQTAGIKRLKNMPVGKISGGEAQKVSLARVLAQQPEIVLLDEPQLNLDPTSQKSFSNLVERLYRGFKFTCLMVTHDIDLIPACCGKVLMMKDGKIALETENNKNIKNKAKEYGIYG